MKIPIIFLLVPVILISCFFSCQSFKQELPSQSLINRYLLRSKAVIPNDAVYAITYLPKNYSKKGSIDYTLFLQKAIDENSFVVFPDFPILINKVGLIVKSNKTVIFQNNSEIKFSGPAVGKFWDVIKIYNASNVKIINANIEGSRKSKIEQSGEWSAGISILNSKNITIVNPKIYDTFGDGIFIGSEDYGVSENITINGGWINNVRRNGISITSAKNVFLNNILISNTNGTLPMAGIDIEPSLQENTVENINLNNIYTYHNESSGIAINMNALSTDVLSKRKYININLNNHSDYKSAYAFSTSLNVSDNKFDSKGIININNPSWEESRNDLYWKSNTTQSILINFKNIKASDNNMTDALKRSLDKQINFTIK